MSSNLNIKTWMMTGGGVGSVLDFPARSACLKISARSEGWFRVPVFAELEEYAPPAAPSLTPAPAAGAAAGTGWFHLDEGESRTLPMLAGQQYYGGVAMWEIGTSEVDFDQTDPGYGR